MSLKAPSTPVCGTCGPMAQVRPAVVASTATTVSPLGGLDATVASSAFPMRLDDLELEGLVAQPLGRLLGRDLLAHEPLVPLHDLAHATIDRGQVRGVDRLGQVEVVVEAVGDGGPDRVLRPRVEVAHGLGEHVRRGVTQHVQALVGPGRYGFDERVGRGHERQVAQLAVDASRDRALGERGADRLPLGELEVHTFGKGQRRHAGMIASPPALLVGDRLEHVEPRGASRRPDGREHAGERREHEIHDELAHRHDELAHPFVRQRLLQRPAEQHADRDAEDRAEARR